MVTIPVTQPFSGRVSVGSLGGFAVLVMVGSGATEDGATEDGATEDGATEDGATAGEGDRGGAEAEEPVEAPHPAASAPAATAMPILW
ncbi:hypothetical protein GCM10010168_67000 [Actinoplanes ianthinogenes]|nr:hypothetical protein GCM10010168_67000 [Actinoplanes ianthinogenes]